MHIDYPAAHSMDSTWFAVDKNGHVAVFDTGESGAMPKQAAGGDDFDTRPLELTLGVHQKRGYIREPDWSRDLYVYEHGDGITGPYTRLSVPEKPVAIEQLPEPIRSELTKAVFDGVDFAEASTLQPIPHLLCFSWEPYYITDDGKTIRPVPGREDDYAEYHAEHFSDGAVGAHFEIEPPTRIVVPKPKPTAHTRHRRKKPWWWPF